MLTVYYKPNTEVVCCKLYKCTSNWKWLLPQTCKHKL